jgi:hypothetical protein
MEFRMLNESDYDTFCSWWKDWRWTPPSADSLPENGLGGVMVLSNGVEVCGGFVYLTNSKTAWIEFIVSDFKYREKDRQEAILYLINVLIELVKDSGDYKYIYTSLKNESLINTYASCGFVKGSTRCTEMIKTL